MTSLLPGPITPCLELISSLHSQLLNRVSCSRLEAFEKLFHFSCIVSGSVLISADPSLLFILSIGGNSLECCLESIRGGGGSIGFTGIMDE